MSVSAVDVPVERSPRRRGGRAHLAALPDPAEQRELEAVADRRARERIAAAEAAGQPLLARNGTRRGYATLPEYRRGRAPANKGLRFPAEILTADEVNALINAQRRTAEGLRNRALIAVLWRAGLRCAEALALMPHHVSAETRLINVLAGKGAKQRMCAIDDGALRYVDAWMTERARLGIPDTAPLFCTVRGRQGLPIQGSWVRDMLKQTARKAGINKRVHPHGLRHTHAFELSMEGIPVRVIQVQLGHESLDQTAHYIDHLSPPELVARIGARSYPGHLAPAPTTEAAMSAGKPVPTTAHAVRARVDPPEPDPGRPLPVLAREQAEMIVSTLWKLGPAPLAAVMTATGLPETSIRRRLAELEAEGSVERAGRLPSRAMTWRATAEPAVSRAALTPRPENRDLVLDILIRNGGSATQAQLVQAVALSPMIVLRTIHELHSERKLIRAGFDRRRAIIWKLAPPPVVLVPIHEYRQAPRGEGANRVLDALEALGGRASQAELARVLELQPTTVRHHCMGLVKRGVIQRVGLDKSTSHRGSPIWALRTQLRVTRSGSTSRELKFVTPR